MASSSPLPPAGADGWISLFNGYDLSGWYTMLQKSGRGVAEQRKIVAIEDGMLHILGNELTAGPAEAGYIATNQEFENVHIRVEYKWGVNRFPPRTLTKRDNGLLYGLVGTDKVWPTMVECQIEEGDVGDYFLVGGIRGVQDRHDNGLFGEGLTTDGWSGAARPSSHGNASPEPVGGRKIKDGNFEKLNDWNVVEVIWQGDRSAHIVNGRTVNTVSMLQQPDPANPGKFIPLTRGKIAIEIEFAEIWYRRIEVRSLA
jgi:3-keto-disaccharide hydrolase